MAVELKRYRFTIADYYRMAEVGILKRGDRVELIDGEIIRMSPISGRHASCVDRMNRLFSRGVGDAAIVRVQNPIRLNDYGEPEPDLALLESRADYYASGHPAPEAVLLVVEVAESSVDYDRQVKAPLFARNEIAEYWLVNLPDDHVTVYRDPKGGSYATVRVYRRGETISPVAFPALPIAVADLLG